MPIRKTILITGASSGLGAGMAREFARRGRHLALCARRLDRLEELKRELLGLHPDARVSIRAIDVTDYDQVFTGFGAFHDELGKIDRIIVNAGLGKGRPVGTGSFHANRQTAETNFVAALAQCEAAVGLFRAQNEGHLVTIASVSGVRGFPGNVTTYAASKAGLAALTDGIRLDLMRTPIRVSTIYPGYIRTEMNAQLARAPFMVDELTGVRALVRAIEREPARAYVPAWPWLPIGIALRVLPSRLLGRIL
jgi:short-subunit dehydrogenase